MRTDDAMLSQLVFGNTAVASINAVSLALYCTDIVNLRFQIRQAEYTVVGWNLNSDPDGRIIAPTPGSSSTNQQELAAVRQLKRQLQQLVTARHKGVNLDGSAIVLNGLQLNTLFGPSSPGGRVPEQPAASDAWWLQWEAHQPPLNGVFTAPNAPQLWDANNPFTPIPIP